MRPIGDSGYRMGELLTKSDINISKISKIEWFKHYKYYLLMADNFLSKFRRKNSSSEDNLE